MSQYQEALGLPLRHIGKVRELFDFEHDGKPCYLMVATDSVSAFDHVLPTRIPGKGAILTQLSSWWFEEFAEVPNHVVSTAVPEAVAGRAVIVEKLDMVPVECVARGYLTGSGWAEYLRQQTVCGIALPAGLRDGDRLPEPIFTPAIKAGAGGHDENVDFATIVDLHGTELAERLRQRTLELYSRAAELTASRGIILADTKFEFGLREGELVLADEVLTPDSSRFWDAQRWAPGESLPSFDKQFVRDWLANDSGWDRVGPPPELPADVVAATRERYVEAFRRITGRLPD